MNSRSINHQLNPPQIIGNSSGAPPHAGNVMNRPASAYFNNNSNSSNVMNLSSPTTPNIPNTPQQQSTSTGNLMQTNPSTMMGYNHNTNNMMPSPAQAHISHPNLSGMSNASSSITNSPITAHRPPMMPSKQQQGNFNRDAQSQLSLRSQQQQQMMAPSMPNIPHASGYAATIPASQSMQNVNQVAGNYQMFQLQQQQQEPQLSPNHQASLLRGTAKMAEMGELLKRQQRNQQQQMSSNGPIHYTNSMDNIHIPQANSAMPQMLASPHAQQQRQAFHPQSPQKQLPTTAPKQVCASYMHVVTDLYFYTKSLFLKLTK